MNSNMNSILEFLMSVQFHLFPNEERLIFKIYNQVTKFIRKN